MPHDSQDRPLAVGDRVTLAGSIERITGSANGCNVTVKIDAPPGEYSPSLALNSRSTTQTAEASTGDGPTEETTHAPPATSAADPARSPAPTAAPPPAA